MSMARDEEREVVYVEHGGGGIKPILFGALLGVAVGLLFAPQSGAETRRVLKRRLRKVRALAEEKVGELSERITEEWGKPEASTGEERREEARSELERRLDEARARRRQHTPAEVDEDEEPVA
jgi:gas vesicle protein